MAAIDIAEIAEAPDLVRALEQSKSNLTPGAFASGEPVSEQEWRESVFEGQRNSQITRLVGAAFQKGDPTPVVLRKTLEFNRTQCNPPLDPKEVEGIVASVESREKERRAGVRDDLGTLLEEIKEADLGERLERLDDVLGVVTRLPRGEHDAYLKPLAKLTHLRIDNLRRRIRAYTEPAKVEQVVDPAVLAAGEEFAKSLGGRVLEEATEVVQRSGVVGERINIMLLFLVLTSRLLPRPASAVVKGVSSGGKSFTVAQVVRLVPARAVIERTGMSPKALAYTDEVLKHRTIILYEVEGMGDGGEYLLRSLLSEGRLSYETVESTPLGLKAKVIEKEGPTNLIMTTTRPRIHPENETRVLSLSINDTAEQTRQVLHGIAVGAKEIDYSRWHALQHWLRHETPGVVIPFAERLADLTNPATPRIRRDFRSVLSLLSAHALLCQTVRERDAEGRIIASIEDYRVVRDLVAALIEEACLTTVKPTVRETVEAVAHLTDHESSFPRTTLSLRGKILERKRSTPPPPEDGEDRPQYASVGEVAAYLDIDRSTASRRVAEAIALEYVVNDEGRPGRPAKLKIGEPLPEDETVLPQPEDLIE